MKYLIVGLGNFGIEYVGTRHNIGFEVLDHLAAEKEVAFESKRYADYAEIKHRGKIFCLIKPTTFMNLSGKAVHYWLTKLKLPVDRMLVVVDDLNIPFGKIRIRPKGSDGGHNGLHDIQRHLNTTKYARLRFGIGDDFGAGRQVNFVLGKWSREEQAELETTVPQAGRAVLAFGTMGLSRAMNKYNSEVKPPVKKEEREAKKQKAREEKEAANPKSGGKPDESKTPEDQQGNS